MSRITSLLAIAVAASLSAAPPAALAAAPLHETVQVDDTFTWDDCGFVVEEHLQATLRFISWSDASGARTRQIVVAPGSRITFTNPLTGASVTTASPYAVHKRDHPDGSATVAFTGLRFAVHGGGRAYVTAGRDVIVFSPDHVEPISTAGVGADLCEALAATIG